MNFDLPILAPSILAANFLTLRDDIQKTLNAGVRWIHCDIMDGHFVPNISYGASIVKQVSTISDDAFIDVHLMIENADFYVEDFANAGADLIAVHYEACPHLHRSIQKIKSLGIMAGVAINPATAIHAIEPILPDVDMVVLMSVNPGFGGQSFIESTYNRLQELVDIRASSKQSFLIQVDGGVNLKNIAAARKAGADVLVAGSSVFKAENIPLRIEELTELL
jgi:ribulose-phosphate 3-epimerase